MQFISVYSYFVLLICLDKHFCSPLTGNREHDLPSIETKALKALETILNAIHQSSEAEELQQPNNGERIIALIPVDDRNGENLVETKPNPPPTNDPGTFTFKIDRNSEASQAFQNGRKVGSEDVASFKRTLMTDGFQLSMTQNTSVELIVKDKASAPEEIPSASDLLTQGSGFFDIRSNDDFNDVPVQLETIPNGLGGQKSLEVLTPQIFNEDDEIDETKDLELEDRNFEDSILPNVDTLDVLRKVILFDI